MARKLVRASSQYLDYAGSPVTAYPFTLAIWLQTSNPTIGSNQNALVLNSNVNNDQDAIGIGIDNATGKFEFFVSNSSGTFDIIEPSAALSANVWANAVWSCASATSRTGYSNGGNAVSSSVNIALGGSTAHTLIGAYNGSAPPADFLDGPVAEAAIWNVALTAGEAAAYNAGIPAYQIRPGALVFYAPLWGLASPEPDLAGSAHNLTLHASPALANHAPITLWTPKARTPPDITASSVNVTLVAVSATGAVAGFTPNVQPAAAGVSGTGAAGALGILLNESFGAATATGTVGGPVAQDAFALASVSGTATALAPVSEIDITLGAVSATAAVGALSPMIDSNLALGAIAALGVAVSFGVIITSASGQQIFVMKPGLGLSGQQLRHL